jgi:hypothetical protein
MAIVAGVAANCFPISYDLSPLLACSEITLTGEFQFHISTPPGIEPGSLMTGSKGLTNWTSETVCECSEIAGSPQAANSGSCIKWNRTAGSYLSCEDWLIYPVAFRMSKVD